MLKVGPISHVLYLARYNMIHLFSPKLRGHDSALLKTHPYYVMFLGQCLGTKVNVDYAYFFFFDIEKKILL